METSEILNQINSIFCSVLEQSTIQLKEETTAQDVDGWDSLSNITLISEIEKHFGIKFKLREILKLKNIGDLCLSVQKKIE